MKQWVSNDNTRVSAASRTAPAATPMDQTGWPLQRRAGAAGKVMFILDARGRIQYWSTPEALTSSGTGLLGKPIRHVLPHLPLRHGTPGYNIAFARLSCAEERWLAYHVRLADATLHPAEIHLKPIPLERGFCLLGLVRLTGAERRREQSRWEADQRRRERRMNRSADPPALRMDFSAYQNDRRAEAPTTLAV